MVYETLLLAQGAEGLPLEPAIWGFLGTVIVGILGFLGAQLQRRAKERGDTSNVIIATGREYRELIQIMRTELTDQRSHLRDIDQRLNAAEQTLEDTEALLNETAGKLQRAERRLAAWARFGQAFVEWIAGLPEDHRSSAPHPPT